MYIYTSFPPSYCPTEGCRLFIYMALHFDIRNICQLYTGFMVSHILCPVNAAAICADTFKVLLPLRLQIEKHRSKIPILYSTSSYCIYAARRTTPGMHSGKAINTLPVLALQFALPNRRQNINVLATNRTSSRLAGFLRAVLKPRTLSHIENIVVHLMTGLA